MFISNEEFKELMIKIEGIENDIKYLRKERESVGCKKKDSIKEDNIKIITKFIEDIEADEEAVRMTVAATYFYEMFNKWQVNNIGYATDITERLFGGVVGKSYVRVRQSSGKAYMNVPVKFRSNVIKYYNNLTGEIRPQVSAKDLYEEYTHYCIKEDEEPTTRNQFGAIIKTRLDKKRITGGYVYLNVPSIK